ncbi:MAG TPA: hypothetical protein VGF13_01565 [Verrucomicrobiae bacterium]|jgi:hypothetical protein
MQKGMVKHPFSMVDEPKSIEKHPICMEKHAFWLFNHPNGLLDEAFSMEKHPFLMLFHAFWMPCHAIWMLCHPKWMLCHPKWMARRVFCMPCPPGLWITKVWSADNSPALQGWVNRSAQNKSRRDDRIRTGKKSSFVPPGLNSRCGTLTQP